MTNIFAWKSYTQIYCTLTLTQHKINIVIIKLHTFVREILSQFELNHDFFITLFV